MKTISFLGLQRFYNKYFEEIKSVQAEAVKNGIFIDGLNTNKLEAKIANYCNRNVCCITGSGTDALFFALKALNIGKNDEVLVTALSFIASATAITRAGAKPVFVDVDANTALMNLDDAETKITTRTKAILFVDLYGNLPDIDLVEKFATSHNLFLIEDAAQAFGSNRNNRKAGSMGDVSILSFDPTKPIGAFGTGGAVLTNNEHIANYCRAARQNGKNNITGYYDQFGINSRISEMQAALIDWQIENFASALHSRQQKATGMIQQIQSLPIHCLVKEQLSYSGNFHKMVISHKNRDELRSFLHKNNIETKIHYGECLYHHPVLSKHKNYCSIAESYSKSVVSLPFYPELEEKEIGYICQAIKQFFS